jgi:hypothetical protein
VNGDQSDDSTAGAGAVYVFRRSGATWAQEAYLKASNPAVDDAFGSSLSLSGDTLAVGAPYESSSATGVDGDQTNDDALYAGAVYVFRRTGTEWVQEAYVKASNTGAEDYFGSAVALGPDLLAVGAPGEDSNATGVDGNQASNTSSYAGAVYVFRRSGTEWAQEAYVKASNTGSGDQFGDSLSLSGDTLAVGAFEEDGAATGVNGDESSNAATYAGAVYVLRRGASAWAQEAYVKASNTGSGDRFGRSVSVAGDLMVVGADQEDSGAIGIGGDGADNSASNAGAAYVFRRDGTSWAQQAYLKASNTGVSDRFGWAAAAWGDAVVVAAFGEDSNATGIDPSQADESASDAGAAYLYRWSGSAWAQEAYVKASNTDAGDSFGLVVAASSDTLAIGAHMEASAATGVDGDQADDSAWHAGAVYVLH